MAMQTPVVSTSKGAEGLEIESGTNILIADKPDEFANHVIRLFNNMNLRNKIAANGRKLVEEKYNWDKIGNKFLSLAENIVHLESKSRKP